MRSDDIKQCIEEIELKIPPHNRHEHHIVVTRYSHEDHPPRIPGQLEYTTDPDFSYCLNCTKELNLSVEKHTRRFNMDRGAIINLTGRHPYSFFGYCDNCMLPLYEINTNRTLYE